MMNDEFVCRVSFKIWTFGIKHLLEIGYSSFEIQNFSENLYPVPCTVWISGLG